MTPKFKRYNLQKDTQMERIMSKSEIRLEAYNRICQIVFMLHLLWYRYTGFFIPDGNFFMQYCLPKNFWKVAQEDIGLISEDYITTIAIKYCKKETNWTREEMDAAIKAEEERTKDLNVDKFLEWGQRRTVLEDEILQAVSKFEKDDFGLKIYALNYCSESIEGHRSKIDFIYKLD